jgi:site-specific recombinase XerC
MKRAARAFRLKVNAGPHSARKVYAVELMRKYGDLEKVRRALNHDSAAVTLLYALADMQRSTKKGVDKPGAVGYHGKHRGRKE